MPAMISALHLPAALLSCQSSSLGVQGIQGPSPRAWHRGQRLGELERPVLEQVQQLEQLHSCCPARLRSLQASE